MQAIIVVIMPNETFCLELKANKEALRPLKS